MIRGTAGPRANTGYRSHLYDTLILTRRSPMSRMPISTIRQAVSALHVFALVALFFAAAPDVVHSAPPTPKTISIAEARSLPLGTVVTIKGSVTVPSGAFSSSTFDQGFAIQDRTGGIYVSTPDNLGLAPRRRVRVTGELADTVLPGLLVLIDVTDITPKGSGPKVQALAVATGDVGEATEGKLVTITGTITQPISNDLPFGFTILINDGSGEVQSFVCASTGIDVNGLSPGQRIEVTGFSGQFADDFEVDPRFQSDIRVLP
jgi:uncharacterized protein YdeI (BOF family)